MDKMTSNLLAYEKASKFVTRLPEIVRAYADVVPEFHCKGSPVYFCNSASFFGVEIWGDADERAWLFRIARKFCRETCERRCNVSADYKHPVLFRLREKLPMSDRLVLHHVIRRDFLVWAAARYLI
jgi:hypothetical protein